MLDWLFKPQPLGALTHDPQPCQGELFGLQCDDTPLYRCHKCKMSLCALHAFEADYHHYCYACLYEGKQGKDYIDALYDFK